MSYKVDSNEDILRVMMELLLPEKAFYCSKYAQHFDSSNKRIINIVGRDAITLNAI